MLAAAATICFADRRIPQSLIVAGHGDRIVRSFISTKWLELAKPEARQRVAPNASGCPLAIERYQQRSNGGLLPNIYLVVFDVRECPWIQIFVPQQGSSIGGYRPWHLINIFVNVSNCFRWFKKFATQKFHKNDFLIYHVFFAICFCQEKCFLIWL